MATNPAAPIRPTVSTADRLCFTLFVGVTLHVAIILGISFDIDQSSRETPVIEVTLSQTSNNNEVPPEQADYLAQQDQQGGGTLEEKALTSIQQPVEYVEERFQEVTEASQNAAPEVQQRQDHQLVTQISEQVVVNQDPLENQETTLEEVDAAISLLERSLALASIDAQLDQEQQFNTRKTRVKDINMASTMRASDAFYVKQWLNKIHRVGRLNYPEEARRRQLFGSLRMTVSVLPDGSVDEIKILRSSGHKLLDDAAVRIVRLAEPFAPFPDQLKQDYDVLNITRTWLFSKDGKRPLLSGSS